MTRWPTRARPEFYRFQLPPAAFGPAQARVQNRALSSYRFQATSATHNCCRRGLRASFISEGDDEGDKLTDFQSLASLHGYVLVAQDERCARVFRRDGTRAWPSEPETYHHDDRFELPTLTSGVAAADIYDGILDTIGRSLLRA